MEETLKLLLEKVESMDTKFDQIDKKLEQMDKRFNQVDKKLEQMDKRFNQVDKKLEQMDKRLKNLEKEQTRQANQLNDLTGIVKATNVKISETNERIDNLETRFFKLDEDVQLIKNTMVIKTDLEYYDRMISEHSREIYKIKNR
jgi:peptidoglycan hydrolase CwlO-like protein